VACSAHAMNFQFNEDVHLGGDTMDQKTATVVVADGHEIVREGICWRIQQLEDCEVVGQADDGYKTIKVCRQLQPDILIMDLSLVRPSGRETLTKICKSLPDLKVIVLSSEATISNAFFVLSLGAVGFMPKQAGSRDILNAVEAARRGYTYMPNLFIREFVHSRRNLTRTGNIYGLSPREIEILEACINGQSTKEVAYALNISVRTVETHRNSIYKKTSCRNVSELSAIVEAL